jgi:hypothetical protein
VELIGMQVEVVAPQEHQQEVQIKLIKVLVVTAEVVTLYLMLILKIMRSQDYQILAAVEAQVQAMVAQAQVAALV